MAKKEIREQQILTIALQEFITKGYYGTSTREISKIAGISSGLMFHYFESKDALFHRLLTLGTEKMVFSLEQARQNPKEYIRNVTEGILTQLKTNEFFANMFVFMDDAQHTTGIPSMSKDLLEQHDLGAQLIPIFQLGQQMGQFRVGSAHALCVAFFGAIQGIAQEIVRVPNTPLPEVEWLMNMICE